jgi:hypothetical protein
MPIWRRAHAVAPNVIELGGVAPDAKPENAYVGFTNRLRKLKRLNAAPREEKATELKSYRTEALKSGYHRKEPYRSPLLDVQFPYVHNEFLFNSARKIGPLAQISHLVFVPLYVDRLSGDDAKMEMPVFRGDPMKLLDRGTRQTLNWMWRRAIHDAHPRDDFRGGKDDILHHVTEVPDYSEPYATPKRYILDAKKEALAKSSEAARAETEEYDSFFHRSGYSNILANTAEFFWRASQHRKGHFRWARHDRPYQTFTFTNEYSRTLDEQSAPIPLGSEEWTKVIIEAIKQDRDDPNIRFPFDHNAMQDLKSDMFGKVLGQYAHGANVLVLPLKLFLDSEIAPRFAPHLPPTSLLNHLVQLAPDGLLSDDAAHRWQRFVNAPDADGLWDSEFRALMRSFQDNAVRTAQRDALVVGATRKFLLKNCLLADPRDRFDSEFVGYKCMGGRAYVFTDVRNRPHKKKAEHDGLFSRTVIIDCGLSHHERGRLVQTITEFASERILSVQSLARFRLLHHALNVVQTRVSLALACYQSNVEQHEESLPSEYIDLVQRQADVCGPEGLLNSLEFLSSCLSVLNDVVEGGIMDRSHASGSTHHAILKKLDSIRQESLQGFQSLSEYLERRSARPLRTIARVGERYEMLRLRITQIAELVNVRMQVGQSESQQKGIVLGAIITLGAMILAVLALPHPLGTWLEELKWGSYKSAVGISVVIGLLILIVFWAYRKVWYRLPSRKRQRNVKWALEQIKRNRSNGETYEVLKK